MSIAALFLPELDREIATTRRFLECVPEAQADWSPHQKSMTMGKIAVHLATLPIWGTMTLSGTELDLASPDANNIPRTFTTRDEAVAMLDANAATFRELLEKATDEEMMAPWSLKSGGTTHFTLPRVAVLRSMVFSHIVHHRAQLGVYLRMNDIPVPASFGPTADGM